MYPNLHLKGQNLTPPLFPAPIPRPVLYTYEVLSSSRTLKINATYSRFSIIRIQDQYRFVEVIFLVIVKRSCKVHLTILGVPALFHQMHLVEVFSERRSVLKNKFSTHFNNAHCSQWRILGLKVVPLIADFLIICCGLFF